MLLKNGFWKWTGSPAQFSHSQIQWSTRSALRDVKASFKDSVSQKQPTAGSRYIAVSKWTVIMLVIQFNGCESPTCAVGSSHFLHVAWFFRTFLEVWRRSRHALMHIHIIKLMGVFHFQILLSLIKISRADVKKAKSYSCSMFEKPCQHLKQREQPAFRQKKWIKTNIYIILC